MSWLTSQTPKRPIIMMTQSWSKQTNQLDADSVASSLLSDVADFVGPCMDCARNLEWWFFSLWAVDTVSDWPVLDASRGYHTIGWTDETRQDPMVNNQNTRHFQCLPSFSFHTLDQDQSMNLLQQSTADKLSTRMNSLKK